MLLLRVTFLLMLIALAIFTFANVDKASAVCILMASYYYRVISTPKVDESEIIKIPLD